MESIEKIINECCICHNWKNSDDKYITPTTEQRREVYLEGTKISHGFCGKCYTIYTDKAFKYL